ncbi:MAG: T9SS type A sorting domain-containing protein [Salibacteraceae bacterium]
MRLIFSTTLFLTLIAFQGLGQNLLNPSFENWSPSGQAPPFDWMFPTDWTTSNATTEFIAAGVRQEGNAPDGMFVAEMRTIGIFGDVAPAVLVNGTTGLNFSQYSPTLHDAGTPYTGAATGLTGMYQYTAGQAGDVALVEVWTKKWNTATQVSDTVAYGKVTLGPTANFTTFSLVLQTLLPGTTPDSLVVHILSSDSANAANNSVLQIDGLALDSSVTSVAETIVESELQVFPNPANDEVTITVPQEAAGTLQLHNVLGKEVWATPISESTIPLSLADLPSGIYFLRWKETGYLPVVEKLIVRH